MKKIIYFFISISFVFSVQGCSDFLDKQPDDMKTEEMVWTSRKQVIGYLASIYATIPEKQLEKNDPDLGLSDEVDLTWAVMPTYGINLGNWSPDTDFYNVYERYYRGIRASIVLEQNIHRCRELSNDLKDQYKAEAIFLRAYFYWNLIKLYGPVVLIKDIYPEDTDWTQFSRAPFDECVDYICSLLDEAEQNLPTHWRSSPGDLGRPNKIVCRSVKSLVLTLAASPQWNGNKEYANFKNHDGTPLANTVYDEEKWKKAAEASKSVIQIAESDPDAELRLYKNHENGDGNTFNPYKSIVNTTLENWNCEIIFARTRKTSSYFIYCSPSPYNLGGAAPTQRVVDAFLMNNGKPIEDPASGYVETGFAKEGGKMWNPNNYDLTTDRIKMISAIRNGEAYGHWPGHWNMYANREPRFYASVLYNKRAIPQISDDAAHRNYFSAKKNQDGYGRVEFYYGGTSRGAGTTTHFPRSGYLILKAVDPKANMRERTYPTDNYMDIHIRYATILLNYIEALNEYNPQHPDIRKYWDLIRERAGVPSAFVASPEIKGNQSLQREFILRERQIELCFEGDRYQTTRRRWLAHTPDEGKDTDDRKYGDGGRMWGMNISGGNSATNSFEFTDYYQRTAFETRVFTKAYYLFPIPSSEIDKNKSMVQNPWW